MTAPLVLVDDLAAAGNEVEGAVARRSEVAEICTALAGLPDRQRDALVLREFYGLSQDEIAAALGITASAVESLLVRGRRTVKEALRPARAGAGALAVPVSLRDSLAQALPGFSSASGIGSGAVAAGAAAVATKASVAPLVAKVAVLAVAVTAAVGPAGSTARERRPLLSRGETAHALAAPKPKRSEATSALGSRAHDPLGPGPEAAPPPAEPAASEEVAAAAEAAAVTEDVTPEQPADESRSDTDAVPEVEEQPVPSDPQAAVDEEPAPEPDTETEPEATPVDRPADPEDPPPANRVDEPTEVPGDAETIASIASGKR
jgi:transcriptional regulator with XRE-family HTH domain